MRSAHEHAGRMKLLGQLSAEQDAAGGNGAGSGISIGASNEGSGANNKAGGVGANAPQQDEMREKFDAFVGESFYGQMLKEMHKSVGKTPYFSGGHAEEAFQGQLDQVLSEKMSKANANQFTGSMYDLFNLQMHGGRK
jgi:hypothetical protein